MNHELAHWIKQQAYDLGFNACGISGPDSRHQSDYLSQFLARGFHADMDFLAQNIEKRLDARELLPETRSVICVRMDYLTAPAPKRYVPYEPDAAVIARYAQGRDYHKILRHRLKQLAARIAQKTGPFISRPFTDSAPIFEKPLAEQAGLGWTGKHTLLIDPKAGSFFVLGELLCSLDLPPDTPVTPRCGSCQACLDICPTQAIVAPYQLDARRCIAYLTIEFKGIIPLEFRRAIGNRVFGCDDCQLICPWNRFAKLSQEADFKPRHGLDTLHLLDLWDWSEEQFLKNTEGSPLRRTGYAAFMRNVAVGLGNAPFSNDIIRGLHNFKDKRGDLVAEHVIWALTEQQAKRRPMAALTIFQN